MTSHWRPSNQKGYTQVSRTSCSSAKTARKLQLGGRKVVFSHFACPEYSEQCQSRWRCRCRKIRLCELTLQLRWGTEKQQICQERPGTRRLWRGGVTLICTEHNGNTTSDHNQIFLIAAPSFLVAWKNEFCSPTQEFCSPTQLYQVRQNCMGFTAFPVNSSCPFPYKA